MPRIPSFERSLAAQEGALLTHRIRLKNQSEACRIYARSGVKIWFKCTKPECKHEFTAAPNGIMRSGCPYCSSPPKRLCGKEDCRTCWAKSLASKADELAERNLKYSGEQDARTVFTNQNSKTLFRCTKAECAHSFSAAPNAINNKISGTGCPFCSVPSQRLCGQEYCKPCWEKSLASKADALAARFLKYSDKQVPHTIFINQRMKVLFSCTKLECAHRFFTAPYSIMRHGCPFCTSQQLCGPDEGCEKCLGKTIAARKMDLEKRGIRFAGEDATQVFAKSGANFPWLCLDLACGSVWMAPPASVCSINRPSGCPDCARHKTERMVGKYVASIWGGGGALRADWCRDAESGRVLPFDIYIEIDQRGIIFEVDGAQHFREVAFFNTHRTYEKILEVDRFKQICALENGWHLVRLHQEDVLSGRVDWQAAVHDAVYRCLQSATPLLLFVAADASCYAKHAAAASPPAPALPSPSPGARCVKRL